MKNIKEKPTGRVLKSNVTGKIPKAALKKAWTEAKEKSRTKLRESTAAQGESDYATAQDTGAVLTDTSYSAIKQNTDFTVQQGLQDCPQADSKISGAPCRRASRNHPRPRRQ